MFIIEELKQLWVIGFNLKPAASSVGIHEKKKTLNQTNRLKHKWTYLAVVVEFPAPLCPTSRVVLGFQYFAYEAFISQVYPWIGLIMM